jgi:hypothetical protein
MQERRRSGTSPLTPGFTSESLDARHEKGPESKYPRGPMAPIGRLQEITRDHHYVGTRRCRMLRYFIWHS